MILYPLQEHPKKLKTCWGNPSTQLHVFTTSDKNHSVGVQVTTVPRDMQAG